MTWQGWYWSGPTRLQCANRNSSAPLDWNLKMSAQNTSKLRSVSFHSWFPFMISLRVQVWEPPTSWFGVCQRWKPAHHIQSYAGVVNTGASPSDTPWAARVASPLFWPFFCSRTSCNTMLPQLATGNLGSCIGWTVARDLRTSNYVRHDGEISLGCRRAKPEVHTTLVLWTAVKQTLAAVCQSDHIISREGPGTSKQGSKGISHCWNFGQKEGMKLQPFNVLDYGNYFHTFKSHWNHWNFPIISRIIARLSSIRFRQTKKLRETHVAFINGCAGCADPNSPGGL